MKMKMTAGWVLNALRSLSLDPDEPAMGMVDGEGNALTVAQAIALLEKMDPDTVVNDDA